MIRIIPWQHPDRPAICEAAREVGEHKDIDLLVVVQPDGSASAVRHQSQDGAA